VDGQSLTPVLAVPLSPISFFGLPWNVHENKGLNVALPGMSLINKGVSLSWHGEMAASVSFSV